MKKDTQKGDRVKITEGYFRNFIGEVVSKSKLRIIMFGQDVFIPLDVVNFKKVTARCIYCENEVKCSFEKMVERMLCDSCKKEGSTGKYYHYDVKKWKKEKSKAQKEFEKKCSN